MNIFNNLIINVLLFDFIVVYITYIAINYYRSN